MSDSQIEKSNPNASSLLPTNLDPLAALRAKLASQQAASGILIGMSEDEKEGSNSRYVKAPHPKGMPMAQATNVHWQWSKERDPNDSDSREMVDVHRMIGEELSPIYPTALLGYVLEIRSAPRASFYDASTKTSKTFCSIAGYRTTDMDSGEDVYVKEMAPFPLLRMYAYSEEARYTAPDKTLPSAVYGWQGNCSECIKAGNSVFNIVDSSGKEQTVPCKATSILYFYVTHVGVVTKIKVGKDGQPNLNAKDPSLVMTKTTKDFNGVVKGVSYSSMKVFPIESLYDGEGQPLAPFHLAIQMPEYANRGDWNRGIMPAYRYINALQKLKGLENPTGWMTVISLEMTDKEGGTRLAQPHFEGFIGGKSCYGFMPNKEMVFAPDQVKHGMPVSTLAEGLYEVLDADLQKAIDAFHEWTSKRTSTEKETFDPSELKPLPRNGQVTKQDESPRPVESGDYFSGDTL